MRPIVYILPETIQSIQLERSENDILWSPVQSYNNLLESHVLSYIVRNIVSKLDSTPGDVVIRFSIDSEQYVDSVGIIEYKANPIKLVVHSYIHTPDDNRLGIHLDIVENAPDSLEVRVDQLDGIPTISVTN